MKIRFSIFGSLFSIFLRINKLPKYKLVVLKVSEEQGEGGAVNFKSIETKSDRNA